MREDRIIGFRGGGEENFPFSRAESSRNVSGLRCGKLKSRARRDSISIKSIERRGLKSRPPPRPSPRSTSAVRERAGSGSLIIAKVQAYRVDGDSISR